MKRVISLILSLAMVFSFATTAFATMEGTLTDGSITIKDAEPGAEYKLYQILYIESYNKDKNVYAYKANSEWEEWLKTKATDYVEFDAEDLGYVTWVEGADAEAFAKLAQTHAATLDAVKTVTADTTAAPASAVVEFTGLTLGYYLVDTSVGTLCSLDTTNPTVEMYEKNTPPSIDKVVQEDSEAEDAAKEYGWKKVNDADIGQVVNYKTTITAKKGAHNYVVHDRMTSQLDFNNDVTVTLNGNPVDATNYTVSTTPTCTCDWDTATEGAQGCTFTVTFTQAFQDTLEDDYVIVVTYSATVNDTAVVKVPMYNDTYLGYGNNHKTAEIETKTYTWDMEVLKYGNGNKEDKLEGAEFKILNKDQNKAAVIVNGEVTKWDTVENGTVLRTDTDGKIYVAGLDADTYYLKEVKAPDGYNKLKEDVEFVIEAEEVETNDGGIELKYETVKAEVENKSGAELPSTGGMGTTLFYIVGAVMVLGSAVVFVTKKRMGEAE